MNRHVEALAEEFLGRGHHVRVLAPFDPPGRVFNRLAARIAVSEAAAWTGRRWFGGHYEVIPNGVDVDAAPRAPKPPGAPGAPGAPGEDLRALRGDDDRRIDVDHPAGPPRRAGAAMSH